MIPAHRKQRGGEKHTFINIKTSQHLPLNESPPILGSTRSKHSETAAVRSLPHFAPNCCFDPIMSKSEEN